MNLRQFVNLRTRKPSGPSRRDVLRGLLGAGLISFGPQPVATVAAGSNRSRRKRSNHCDVCARGCRFKHLQSAIDAATPGATIRLCQGTYRGQISITRDLTLSGAGRKQTALDGERRPGAAVITVGSGATVTVRELTVRGGNGNNGGGVDNAGALTLAGVTVTENHASQGAGIVNQIGGTLTLTNSLVTDNTANSQGGGLFLFGGQVTLDASQVTANKADPEQSGQGGGIFVFNGALRLTRSSVAANVAGLAGGGLFHLAGATRLDDSRVIGNKATGTSSQGGGLKILDGAVTLSGTEVTGNKAAAGGGLYKVGGALTIDPDSVTGNTPDNCAGQAVANCIN
ncbi:MAG: hypothetical protein U0031_05720 [Thermomicrobiales bacterium]